MKFVGIIAAASGLVAVSSGQFTTNSNGSITCAMANATYCAGANIIIRCDGMVGYAGNCNDNLAGEPPVGVNYAPCFQCSSTSGRAACSKNGIVYPGSGTGLGSTPFPINASSSVCASNGGMPYPNGTNPGGPIINATTSPSPSGGSGGGPSGYPSATGTAPIASYTGSATTVHKMGAGAAAGFGALLLAFGML